MSTFSIGNSVLINKRLPWAVYCARRRIFSGKFPTTAYKQSLLLLLVEHNLVVSLCLNHGTGACLSIKVATNMTRTSPIATIQIVRARTLLVKHLGVIIEEVGITPALGNGQVLLQHQLHEVTHKDSLEQSSVTTITLILEDVVLLVDKIGDTIGCRLLCLLEVLLVACDVIKLCAMPIYVP